MEQIDADIAFAVFVHFQFEVVDDGAVLVFDEQQFEVASKAEFVVVFAVRRWQRVYGPRYALIPFAQNLHLFVHALSLFAVQSAQNANRPDVGWQLIRNHHEVDISALFLLLTVWKQIQSKLNIIVHHQRFGGIALPRFGGIEFI